MSPIVIPRLFLHTNIFEFQVLEKKLFLFFFFWVSQTQARKMLAVLHKSSALRRGGHLVESESEQI